MLDDNSIQKLTLLKPVGCRRFGRSKLRWIDGLKDDQRMLSVRRWRQKALAGRERKKVLEAAWAEPGCRAISSSMVQAKKGRYGEKQTNKQTNKRCRLDMPSRWGREENST
jgi:hypothetical protein